MQTIVLSPEEVKSLLRKNMTKRNFRDENIDGGGGDCRINQIDNRVTMRRIPVMKHLVLIIGKDNQVGSEKNG